MKQFLSLSLCTFIFVVSITALQRINYADETPKLRQMKYTSRSREKAIEWQKILSSKLASILKIDDLLKAKDQIRFNDVELSQIDKGAYALSEVELNSTPGRKITVTLTVPLEGEGPFPAVVCIHGHGGTQKSVYDKESVYKGFAAELASHGYVTIAADVGQHEVYEEGRILMGERLWDLIRCVDFLCAQSNVDSRRIGCGGLSLGGEMAMWLGAMDTRIAATVSSGFLTVMDQMEQNHCLCWKFDGLRELVDYADIYSLIAPRQLQCQNGLKEGPNDFCVTLALKAMEEIRNIYTDFGYTDYGLLDVHSGGHEIDLPVLMDFFNQHLKSGGS